MARLTLSGLQVDQEQLVTQLTDDLSKNTSWVDILTAGIGQSIIGWLASIGAYEQYAIQRALEETMLDTAKQDASVIAIARMLGVHIQRKIPGSTSCVLTSSAVGSYTIPAYTQFLFNNSVYLFNRTPLVFTQGVPQTVTLFEGRVITEDLLSAGGPFQRFYIGVSGTNFISDLDFIASTATANITGDYSFTSTTKGLWEVGAGQQVFYQNTLADGTVEVLFGNDVYGAAPLANNIITFTYVNTNGASGNTLSTGLTVTQVGTNYITGFNSTAIANGQDEKTADFYKVFAPFIYSARDRAVTKDDFRALALTYTAQNITDIVFLGQKDTHPSDPTWMNLVQYTLLSTASSFDRTAFETWLSSFCIFQTNFYYVAPTPVLISIAVSVFCNSNATLTNVTQNVYNAIIAFFTPQIGTLNGNVYLSDLYGAIINSDPTISYIQITNPTTDTIVTSSPGTLAPPQRYVGLALISGTSNPNVVVTTAYAAR